MSIDSWNGPKVVDRDYWELDYLKLIRADNFKYLAALFGVMVLVLGATLGAAASGDLQVPWWVTGLCILNLLAAAVAALTCFAQAMELGSAIAGDDRAGKVARRALAEALRAFALKQEQEFGFLLTITGWRPGEGDARQTWALDHAREIREQWPGDFARYRELLTNVDYQRARSDVFETPGHRYGEGTLRYEEIMHSRQDMYDRVARSLRKERAVEAIGRESVIQTEEELTESRVRDLADSLKKKPASPPPGAEDL